ncbi:lipopolysaccharide transport periplasmic protein LptA [Aquincola sp. S2]|uniref:Lipopolysaccharide export system protein LptA n=1 Tax=Pseudaquabacterium terrae TaxID=2732868 RepID=A0ABX2ECV7_9BURK|nr:lipopolysaccharide transport periplasmic protein LptA [Aquabacterium terrae]NRF66344.1 lipopolysaccharide transport periplasmic protein LptA [Aquabacterium terrae]
MTPSFPIRPAAFCCAAALAGAMGAAQAEKTDRSKPMTLESDKPCVVNLVKQTSACSGNVVITQGTLLIRADKVELRETTDGYQVASATGADGRPAQYRQKRDGVDEYVEGAATRIDYDSRANTLRFEGQATARRLRGTVTADEIHGAVIVWDNTAEMFSVQGGAATAANPGGRVRAVLAPRDAASAPPAAAASAPLLRSTPSLGERR